jgi:hypothetical protein
MYIDFNENQRFRQSWVWLVTAGGIAIVLLVIILTLPSKAEDKAGLFSALLAAGVSIGVLALMYFSVLQTRINPYGIQFSYPPFMWKEKFIKWEDVDLAYVRKYRPVGEYGGWGLRHSIGRGRAYNVKGNMGLQLVLKSGKKVLIGTQKPEELDEVLKKLGKYRAPSE